MTHHTLTLGEGMAAAASSMKDRYPEGFPHVHDCGTATKKIQQENGTITFFCPSCQAGIWNGKPEMLQHFRTGGTSE